MNSDTAELAIADSAARAARPPRGARPTPRAGAVGRGERRGARSRPRGRWRRLQASDPARAMAAVRDSWRALWSSRLLVWAAGVGDAC